MLTVPAALDGVGGTLPWRIISGAVGMAGRMARLVVCALPTDLVVNYARVRDMLIVTGVHTTFSGLRLIGLATLPQDGAFQVGAMNGSVSAALLTCSHLRANVLRHIAFSRA